MTFDEGGQWPEFPFAGVGTDGRSHSERFGHRGLAARKGQIVNYWLAHMTPICLIFEAWPRMIHFIACGFRGEPTALGIINGGPTNMNS